jgi:hypothetical protein
VRFNDSTGFAAMCFKPGERTNCAPNLFFCFLHPNRIHVCSNDNDKAWVQKERLLRFDKDFARRTEIFDDQEDYQAPTTWMTAEEEQQSEEKESQKLQALKKPKQLLNLAL